MGAMASAARPFGLAVSAAVDVGPEYACTLREWREAWERPAVKKELIAKLGYPASFWRKYRFYFAYCEAGFDARYILNYQVAFTRLAEGSGAGARGAEEGVGENALAAAPLSSPSSSPSKSALPPSAVLLLALLSWAGGAMAAAAALMPGSSSFANIAPLRAVAALASLAAAAASALAARKIIRGGSAAGAAAAATQLLPPPASLAPIRVNGKLPAAASTAELVAAEE